MAKRKRGEEALVPYLTQRFEVKLRGERLEQVLAIGEQLRQLYNEALTERLVMYRRFIAPLRTRLKFRPASTRLKRKLETAYRRHWITLYDQINALTKRRADDPIFGAMMRTWQEETLDGVEAAFRSLATLRKEGDPDARPPRPRLDAWFQKIPGRSGFKVKDGQFVLSLGRKVGTTLAFTIPKYQLGMLAQAAKLKKFELTRDEHDLSKPGRFWISVSYELPSRTPTEFCTDKAVYLALGASSIGVRSAWGEEVIPLWRSDKYWQPLIEEVERRMKGRIKGSANWEELNAARRRMQVIRSRQHLQDEREMVDYLFRRHGNHFVVTDMVVRSKPRKLADAKKKERGSSHGLNWAAQNTGSLGRLVQLLECKVKIFRGSVRKHKLLLTEYPPTIGHGAKLWMAGKLQESYLSIEQALA